MSAAGKKAPTPLPSTSSLPPTHPSTITACLPAPSLPLHLYRHRLPARPPPSPVPAPPSCPHPPPSPVPAPPACPHPPFTCTGTACLPAPPPVTRTAHRPHSFHLCPAPFACPCPACAAWRCAASAADDGATSPRGQRPILSGITWRLQSGRRACVITLCEESFVCYSRCRQTVSIRQTVVTRQS